MGAIIKGSDLKLYFSIAGTQQIVCHATDCKLKITPDILETTTKSSNKGKTRIFQGKYSYTLTLNGITNLLDAASFVYFQLAILQSYKLAFTFTDNSGISYSGNILVTDVDLDSPMSSVSSFSAALLGDGDIIITSSSVPPTPATGYVLIEDQFGNVLATLTAPGVYNVFTFDTIVDDLSQPAGLVITDSLS